MAERRLFPDMGPAGPHISGEKQQALVEELLQSLIKKAQLFLNGHYVRPEAEELTALRKKLGVTMDQAAHKIHVSPRTWSTRENGAGQSTMPIQEFAMLVLFLLRETKEWSTLKLHGSGKTRKSIVDQNTPARRTRGPK
jgi:DNA-binding XRE family transcriptional regulator